MKYIIIVLLTTIALLASCEDDSPQTVDKTLDIQLSKNQGYEYDTKISGDEEGVSISMQATHFSISEIVRNKSTNYVAVYKYKPALDFVGSDKVEIKISTGSDGAGPPTKIEQITFDFSITE